MKKKDNHGGRVQPLWKQYHVKYYLRRMWNASYWVFTKQSEISDTIFQNAFGYKPIRIHLAFKSKLYRDI